MSVAYANGLGNEPSRGGWRKEIDITLCGNDAAIVRGTEICGDGESGIGKRKDYPALHEPVRVDVTLRNFKRANGAASFDGQNFDAGRSREFIVFEKLDCRFQVVVHTISPCRG